MPPLVSVELIGTGEFPRASLHIAFVWLLPWTRKRERFVMLPGSMGQGSRKRKEKIKGLSVLEWERECERRGDQRW